MLLFIFNLFPGAYSAFLQIINQTRSPAAFPFPMAGASLLLLLLLFTFAISPLLLPLIPALPFDYPTANLSTLWTINSSLIIKEPYPDGSNILPLLLRGRYGPSFAFGFFCYAPCDAFLLSIVIVYTNSGSSITGDFWAPPQVVWSANRDHLVRLNATLLFSPEGNLVLHDSDGSFIWSTNTSGHGANNLNLLDSGNLVILDREGRTLWASFDHPTDSLLLGQSLKEGQRLTANSSPNNAARGKLYLAVLDDGLHAFVDSKPPQIYYSKTIPGTSKLKNQSAFITFNNGSLDMFVEFPQSGVPDLSISLPSNLPSQYMRLDDTGHLRVYGWDGGWKLLREVIDVYPDFCSYPTVCGQYGICSKVGHCTCPQGANGDSSYFKPVNATDSTLGCSALTPISCQAMKSHQLLALDEVSYSNYANQSAPFMDMIDIESCKQACLRNCSCKAALFQYHQNVSSGSCYLPSQIFTLMHNRPEITYYNSSAFIKVQTAFPSPTSSGSLSGSTSFFSRGKQLVTGLVSGFMLAGLLVAFVIISVTRRAKQLEEDDQFDEIPGMLSRFTYDELKSATKNFEQKLGQGGFGTVFKGTLSNGMNIAVKRLDGAGQGKKQFLAEVETIGSIHHINLVSLVGYCIEKSHKLLVLEYMPNGSLDRWIFGRTKDTALDWQTRLNIIMDIAKGLSYLHEECRQRIAHLDIKPQNILLDEYFNAKVADFGLSKLIDRDQSEIMTRMRGTPGYLAPEWLTSIITEKVDVYCFGVVVIEIICGRRNFDPSQYEEAGCLVSIIQEKLRDNQLLDLFDKNCNDIQAHNEEAVEMMRLAVWCLHCDSNKRPSMSMVVKVLEGSSNVNCDIHFNLLGSYLFMP